RKTTGSSRRNRITRRVQSASEEIANPENETTQHPDAETKKREKHIERKEDSRQNKEKLEIEVGAKSGDAQATKNACAASRRGERRPRNPSAAAACDCCANANTLATA